MDDTGRQNRPPKRAVNIRELLDRFEYADWPDNADKHPRIGDQGIALNSEWDETGRTFEIGLDTDTGLPILLIHQTENIEKPDFNGPVIRHLSLLQAKMDGMDLLLCRRNIGRTNS